MKKVITIFVVLFVSIFSVNLIAEKGKTRQVEFVIDGDTVILENNERVRLIGIDAPETNHSNKKFQCHGKKSTNYLRKRIQGKKIRLKYGPERLDKYGRTLAYIYFNKTFINQELVATGNAVAYTRFPFKYKKRFVELQRKAKTDKLGLWGSCKNYL